MGKWKAESRDASMAISTVESKVWYLGNEMAAMKAATWALRTGVEMVGAKVGAKGQMTVLRLAVYSALD